MKYPIYGNVFFVMLDYIFQYIPILFVSYFIIQDRNNVQFYQIKQQNQTVTLHFVFLMHMLLETDIFTQVCSRPYHFGQTHRECQAVSGNMKLSTMLSQFL